MAVYQRHPLETPVFWVLFWVCSGLCSGSLPPLTGDVLGVLAYVSMRPPGGR